MGTQIAIAGTREDIADLVDRAASLGARAVPREIPLDDPPELHDPRQFFDADPERDMFLLPKDLAAVEIMAGESFYDPEAGRVDVKESPVVELLATRIESDAVRPGRLYVGVSSSDPLYASVRRLYNALVKFTDTWATEQDGRVRVGPRAAEVIGAGKLRVK